MTLLDACKEYVVLRSADRTLCALLLGSATAIAVAVATSPGRQVAKTLPTRKEVRMLMKAKEERRRRSLSQCNQPCLSSYQRFLFLLRIAVPSLRSKESGMLITISVLLLVRTYLSLCIARMNGHLSKVVVRCDLVAMVKSLVVFLLWCIPTIITNSSLRYCIEMLSLRVQTNLGHYFHRKYLNSKVFYHVVASHDVEEMDQRITKDIEQWSMCVSGLYTSLFKPIIDVALFSYQVAALGGVRSPLIVVAYYTGFAAFAYALAPDMERVAAEQLKRDGTLITAHQRLVPYAEEIIMTQGQTFHHRLMDRYLGSIVRHGQWASYVRGCYSLVETFFVRYGSSVLGYAVCGSAVFAKSTEGMSAADLTAVFVESSYLFRNLAVAVGEVLKNFKAIFVVRALSNRVYELQETIERAKAASAGMGLGEVVRGDHIEFANVPIVLPTMEVLCVGLSFYVRPGMNLLIVGPNGCGKSSIVRILGELWPLQGGRITKPRNDQIYYVPQRPYMSSGTLRDQITYPLKSSELDVSESVLLNCLEMAMLDDIFLKPDITWESSLAWAGDTLSMGEKQKLAMARLFFHQPRFAILDECSSMMDIEVEKRLYSICRQLGISLITIAHRQSVWRHHNWILHLDGCGGYMFSPITFQEDNGVVLTRVVYASDLSVVGQELRLDLSPYNE
ncbi:70 kDa peroxisomal membrane protein [Trypanosoma grayi]|uniref:70 kDa peroxisomal membrane protein n=1 Tax=Trypanosoma grayi TaxID=71804 RepID=UPI0004F44ACE|nr:70 kDa peroxisomal membrane protein [Trypanosoma grayi]KEG09110.1 70 kDa peroxisomal membrane protein [Trypanosoma grayi]